MDFTKDDLIDGDILLFNNGEVGYLILDASIDLIALDEGYCHLEDFTESLRYMYERDGGDIPWSIVAVRRTSFLKDFVPKVFELKLGELVYENEI